MTRWHLPPPEVLIEQMTDDLSNSAPGLGGFMKAGLDLDLDVGGWCKVLLKTIVEHVSVRVIDQTRRRSSAHGESIIPHMSAWQASTIEFQPYLRGHTYRQVRQNR